MPDITLLRAKGEFSVMTVSLKKQVERARKRYDAAMNAVYACAPTDTTPFRICLINAPLDLKDAFEAARAALSASENDAVAQGKAWRASFGMLTWYR